METPRSSSELAAAPNRIRRPSSALVPAVMKCRWWTGWTQEMRVGRMCPWSAASDRRPLPGGTRTVCSWAAGAPTSWPQLRTERSKSTDGYHHGHLQREGIHIGQVCGLMLHTR
eukprot:4781712-Prymnesium_polylepis.2